MLKGQLLFTLSKSRYSWIYLTVEGPYGSKFPKVDSVMAPGGFLGLKKMASTMQDEKVSDSYLEKGTTHSPRAPFLQLK